MRDLQLSASDLATLLREMAGDLEERAEELRELDALLGDGDLGITVNLLAQALTEYLDTSEETDIGTLLSKCGLYINRMNPSTFGTIIAVAFTGAGNAVRDKQQLGPGDLLLMGESAVAAIEQRGKAKVGDKTLLDALVPAVQAFKQGLLEGLAQDLAVAAAVEAAEDGMKATSNMRARVGRAKMFQDRSIGIQDAGATAMYYMIRSLGRNLVTEQERSGP